MSNLPLQIAYLASSVLFILGLKALSSPATARRGMFLAEFGMLMAVIGTFVGHNIITWEWIIFGSIIGSVIGALMAIFMPMTAMPQRIAISHSFGAMAAVFVGVAEYHFHLASADEPLSRGLMSALGFELLFGSLTITGSLMAFGKLAGMITSTPITYKNQNLSNVAIFFCAVALFALLIWRPESVWAFYVMIAIGLAIGMLIVVPIGGADMPVVISLLNSYAGLSSAATGFAINNKVLIIAGALDGASGFFLSILMSRAMNRSFTNVLFGAVGTVSEQTAAAGRCEDRHPLHAGRRDADARHRPLRHHRPRLRHGGGPGAARRAGVGRAADRAGRHRPLRDPSRGGPHAGPHERPLGRGPGALRHAHGDGPDQRRFPEHRRGDRRRGQRRGESRRPDKKDSPLYGMPILNADKARTVIILKRSLKPGFAGEDNELFYDKKTMMVFGDAKKTLTSLVQLLKR